MLQRFRKIILLVLFLAVAGALYSWWQWDDLLSSYYFQQLNQVEEAKRQDWIDKLIGLDESVIPRTLTYWNSSAKRQCADAEEVLIGLAQKWKDARSANLLQQMQLQWPAWSELGKQSALHVACVALEACDEQNSKSTLVGLARELVQTALAEKAVERGMLRLAVTVARQNSGQLPRELFVALAEQGLSSQDFDVRALTLRLYLQPPFNQDLALLAKVIPYLQDASAEVRRMTLFLVGSHQDLVTDDELLPLLHDKDVEVRGFSEMALRSRGLRDQHIILARLISDENPKARLEVLKFLEDARDLDPVVWLRRLCQDPSEAVRAAAVRAAGYQDAIDLREQLREMAQTDASPTVRQLAGHYLQRGMYGDRAEMRGLR